MHDLIGFRGDRVMMQENVSPVDSQSIVQERWFKFYDSLTLQKWPCLKTQEPEPQYRTTPPPKPDIPNLRTKNTIFKLDIFKVSVHQVFYMPLHLY